MKTVRKLNLTKKLLKLNSDGSVGIGLPIQLARSLEWTADDFINITRTGNTLHITKVRIE